VSHLGDQISALVDGELTGADLDRANAHLAACGLCRAEAAALRQLKRELRALAAASPAREAADLAGICDDEALTRRLLAMAGPGGPVPSRQLRREQYWRERSRDKASRTERSGRGQAGARACGHAHTGAQPYSSQRHSSRRPSRWQDAPRRRGRYMIWSAVSLAVVGIGAAAFSMGGSTADPGPKITPQLEMFGVEHALTSGDVPFPDPTPVPTGATRP
jgi:anti-sigma factor RsiW